MSSSVRVSVRFRPMNRRETEVGKNKMTIKYISSTSMEISYPDHPKPQRFTFDTIYNTSTAQVRS